MIRVRVRELVAGYIAAPELGESIDDFVVAPALGERAGLLGAIGLAQQAVPAR
jgi:fructokinase